MSTRHSRSPSPTQESRKRGRIACVTCRQAKVRCDLTTAPCSRCAKMRLDCSVDPGFKRTNKRDKVNELEDNLQRLKSIVERSTIDGQNTLNSISSNNDTREEVNGSDSPPSVTQLSPSLSNPMSDGTRSRPAYPTIYGSIQHFRCLGDIGLSSSEVQQLFTIYFDKYHPTLPILDSTKGHEEYYEASQVLFWTIIATALRSYQPDATLLTRLTPLLSNRLWTQIGACVRSIGGPSGGDITEIQTLLIHATWPLPSLRLWSDRSMTMAGMALTSSMHMGLHRPGFDAEYAREPPNLDNQRITARSSAWVAAYCLAISVAIENGHEALIPSKDWLINNVCSSSPTIYIPNELRHCAIIMRHANDAFKFFTSMNENPALIPHDPSFFAHVASFEETVTDIDNLYSNEMSLANKIRSQGSLLVIQTMYFLSDQSLEQSRQGALRAYATATNLLNTLISDDNANSFLLYAPNVFLRILARAKFVILRTLFSTHGSTLDLNNGKMLYNTGVFFLRQMSVRAKEKDQALRVAEALKVMWKHMEGEPSFRKQPPLLRIRSRFGASLLYDCLFYYRHAAYEAQNNRTSSAQRESLPTATTTSIDISADTTFQDPSSIRFAEGWTTPSFESFLDSDLSWMDSLIDPVQFAGAS